MSDYADYAAIAPRAVIPFERQPDAVPSSLSAIIGRIEEAVETETASIRSDAGFDIRSSNARKSRYLYELNRAMRGLGPTDLAPEHRDGILRLRSKLSANEAAIRAHLGAVSEVAALLQDAIQRSEADGTYSSQLFARAARG